MNRILVERGEILPGSLARFGGARAAHVVEVLHGEVGQTLKTGEVDGPIGTSEIVAIGGGTVTIRMNHCERGLEPWVDLVLAPPRPRVLKRLLPQLASLGVGKIVLVGAEKVERAFWGATILREEEYRPLLLDGLMQSGTSAMPVVECARNFRRWTVDRLDAEFPTGRRIVAHPGAEASAAPCRGEGRLLLAVGPEGGWTDAEVAMLESRGFERYSLGGRILRTDTALVALLARLMY